MIASLCKYSNKCLEKGKVYLTHRLSLYSQKLCDLPNYTVKQYPELGLHCQLIICRCETEIDIPLR